MACIAPGLWRNQGAWTKDILGKTHRWMRLYTKNRTTDRGFTGWRKINRTVHKLRSSCTKYKLWYFTNEQLEDQRTSNTKCGKTPQVSDLLVNMADAICCSVLTTEKFLFGNKYFVTSTSISTSTKESSTRTSISTLHASTGTSDISVV